MLLAIRRIGICGTDFHIFEGLHPFLQYPRIMGHELSAEVLEAPHGQRLRARRPGHRPPLPLLRHLRRLPPRQDELLHDAACLGVHCDGGMAERIVLPEKNLYPAEGLSLDQAAMVEFLAIGAHAVRRSRLIPGDRALVVGAGPIGIGTALFARIAGAEVTLMDRVPAILDLASRITGIRLHDRSPTTAPPSAIAALTDGDGFDVVFDATGNAAAMEKSFDYRGERRRPMCWSAW